MSDNNGLPWPWQMRAYLLRTGWTHDRDMVMYDTYDLTGPPSYRMSVPSERMDKREARAYIRNGIRVLSGIEARRANQVLNDMLKESDGRSSNM